MKHFITKIRVLRGLAIVAQLVTSQGVLAQQPELPRGSKVKVVLNDRSKMHEGRVIETWEGGFAVDLEGESKTRLFDYSDVKSLLLSRRLGSRVREGALKGGAGLGLGGFVLGYCIQIMSSSNECAGDLNGGLLVGSVFGAAGALLGAGIGAFISHYGPFQPVDLESSRSSGLERVSIDVVPQPDGRIGLGVTLALGGGR